jgi:hypothetical protein
MSIEQTNKDKLQAYIGQGGWIGDIGNKVNNLVGLYESGHMWDQALIHMLTEMMKMTDVNGTPDDLIQKVELNNVIDAIIGNVDPSRNIDPNPV